MNANLCELLRERAAKNPGRAALIHRGVSVTYGELTRRVERRAGALARYGVKKGDRVVIFVPMSTALYEILFSVFSLGAVAVFIDAWADAARLDYAARLAEAKAFVGIPKAWLLFLKSRAMRQIPVKLFPGFGKGSADESDSPVSCAEDDPALVTFTTGSTGVPKAALRTCGFLMAQHRALKDFLGVGEGDVDMATLPIFSLNNLACGATTLIPDFNPARPADFDPVKIAGEAAAAGVTTTAGSPAFYKKLSEAARETNPIPTLRKIFVGGAAVFPEFAEALSAAFPGAAVSAVYGSTEAEPIAAIAADELAASDCADGVPAGEVSAFIELRVVRFDAVLRHEMKEEEWSAAQAAPGEAGEICVAGGHVLKTYYRNPEAEKENKIKVGGKIFHRTGDAGRLVGGRLFLLGRASRVFTTPGGAKAYPALIERELLKLDASSAGTLVRGRDGRAVLILESADPEAARAEALSLDRRRVPYDEIRVVARIPRDPRHASKIDYNALAEQILSEN